MKNIFSPLIQLLIKRNIDKPSLTFLLFFLTSPIIAQSSDTSIDISKNQWHLWLDSAAHWEEDSLYLPPVNLKDIPSNPPTCGWDNLNIAERKNITLPATVEQYYWGSTGNSFGISGNYIGVSWFSTTIDLPDSFYGKKIWLDFESCRLRAEIYINKQLAGYDLINGTPFSVDISPFVIYGKSNCIDVRITDPNGNFAWRDWETYNWGKYDIQPSHGFGGITGSVHLRTTDNSFIEDVFIANTPNLNKVITTTKINNNTNGNLTYTVTEINSGKIVYKQSVTTNKSDIEHSIIINNAKTWSPEKPSLYNLNINYKGNDGSQDSWHSDFGFRWFEVKEVDGDRMFFLNGKRTFLLTAISWGHWPVNGIFPTKELACKQIMAAKNYGLNTLNFHRGIGQTMLLDLADSLGLMYYEEPGGYIPGESAFSKTFKREKLLRMVKRDRNHPSLVIYSMINESNRDPLSNEVEDIKLAHKLDPSRIITFTSTYFGKNTYNGKCPLTKAPIKMHMLPLDTTVYNYGWYDEHHAGGPGVYKDEFYKNKDDFRLYVNNPKEIVFWGEEGAIGTPPRLQIIKDNYKNNKGWDGDTYLNMYDAFNEFIHNNGFTDAFSNVDSLTRKMGNVALYYHGRTIENCRIGNITDGYAINGWENTKIENHSGIVDIFRNPKGDVNTLAYYNQPLYVAIKVKNKVVESGSQALADIYLVNQVDLKGKFNLNIQCINVNNEIYQITKPVFIKGGNLFGQLLIENFEIPSLKEGYTTINVHLLKDGKNIASGEEKLFAVSQVIKTLPTVAVLDTSQHLQKTLNASNIPFNNIKSAIPDPNENILFIGKDMQPGMIPGNFRLRAPILEWVQRGNTLVISEGAAEWAEYLNVKEIVDYRGSKLLDRNWFGGHYFNKQHPIFNGLPQNCVFNWEYQAFAGYDKHREGLRLFNGECIVGCYADHNHELFSALQIIPTGRGKIIITTLDLAKSISQNNQASIVAKRLLQNIINYSNSK